MFRSERMLRTGARSSDLETSLPMQSWADYIIGTHESSFWKRQAFFGDDADAAEQLKAGALADRRGDTPHGFGRSGPLLGAAKIGGRPPQGPLGALGS